MRVMHARARLNPTGMCKQQRVYWQGSSLTVDGCMKQWRGAVTLEPAHVVEAVQGDSAVLRSG